MLLACCAETTEPRAIAVSLQRPTEPTVSMIAGVPVIEAAPPTEMGDGLERLPVTESTATMLVTRFPYDAATGESLGPELILLDLASEQTVSIDDVPDLGGVAFSDTGDAWWVSGDRSFGRIDATTGERTEIQLPAGVSGAILGGLPDLHGYEGLLTVTVGAVSEQTQQQPERERQTVALESDGSLRCAGPMGVTFPTSHAGTWWSEDLTLRWDPMSCKVTDGLRLAPGESVSVAATDEDVYAVVRAPDDASNLEEDPYLRTVRRFDGTTGDQLSSSDPIEEINDQPIVHGDEVWVLSGVEVLRLDAETLEELGTAELPNEYPECDRTQHLVPHATDVYLVDDCNGILYLLDPVTGRAEKGWGFPYDDGSDTEIHATPSDDGLWIVNAEQSAVPYLFDTEQQRFERLPFPDSLTSTLFALEFAVAPGPGD